MLWRGFLFAGEQKGEGQGAEDEELMLAGEVAREQMDTDTHDRAQEGEVIGEAAALGMAGDGLQSEGDEAGDARAEEGIAGEQNEGVVGAEERAEDCGEADGMAEDDDAAQVERFPARGGIAD